MKTLALLVVSIATFLTQGLSAGEAAPQIELNLLFTAPGKNPDKPDVLSAPRIIVVSGQDATLAIGQEVPLDPENPNEAASIQVGLTVSVTPKLNADGNIDTKGSINFRSLAPDQPKGENAKAWKIIHSLESAFSLKLQPEKPSVLEVPPSPEHPKGLTMTITARAIPQINAAVSYLKAFSLLPELDPAESKLLNEGFTVIGEEHGKLLEKAQPALAAFAEAATATYCDWQLDMTQGPELALPHLTSARQMARFSLLQARAKLQDEDVTSAISLWGNTLKLRVACAEPPLLISELVGVSIEEKLLSEIAGIASQLTPDQRLAVRQLMQNLPPLDPARSVLAEQQFMVPWLKNQFAAALHDKDGNGMKKLGSLFAISSENSTEQNQQAGNLFLNGIDELAVKAIITTLETDYTTLIDILKSPEQEQAAQLDAWEKSLVARKQAVDAETAKAIKEGKLTKPELFASIPSLLILPSVKSFSVKMRDSRHKRLLFLAALELFDNPKAAEGEAWPLKSIPHRIDATEKALILECDSLSGAADKPIRVEIPR